MTVSSSGADAMASGSRGVTAEAARYSWKRAKVTAPKWPPLRAAPPKDPCDPQARRPPETRRRAPLSGQQLVQRETEASNQAAVAAHHRHAGHTHTRDCTGRRGEAVDYCNVKEIGQPVHHPLMSATTCVRHSARAASRTVR
jgi:hypothetical protein